MTPLDAFIGLLLGILGNLGTDSLAERRRRLEQSRLDWEQTSLRSKPLQEQLRIAVVAAAKQWEATPEEDAIRNALVDGRLLDDFSSWLVAWQPEARAALADRWSSRLRSLVQDRFPDLAQRFEADLVADIEQRLFQDPVLAQWRLSLGLESLLERQRHLELTLESEGEQTREALRNELASLRGQLAAIAEQFGRFAHEQAGRYDRALLTRALTRYRELALESGDIIDLANLPEGDRNLAVKQLELRRLYVPLKVCEEAGRLDAAALEQRRDAERLSAAGHRAGAGSDKQERRSIGEILRERQRVVALGDPGAGKTTILRWIATSYLLRLKSDPAWSELPDVASLPDADWLPVLIRCRDLDTGSLNSALDDVLRQTFRKAELAPDLGEALQAGLRDRLAEGTALLMIDGLDEIASPRTRSTFSRQLERIAAAYPLAPMLVSSRIVGYREMGQDIGRGFAHVTVADLDTDEKDLFAERWCALTEPPERQPRAKTELIQAIHSSDRIERLTGNPMLLTTLALVKRKVGKLPTRRAELYWEAVQVLLNWRAEVDEPIDTREAIPQLEYLAYEMCRRGVQRLQEDEILELWERIREEHARIRPLRNHTPEEFLHLLKRRTGLLVEAGHEPHAGRPVPVFEFRHLTFQEYLAALALIDGRWPGYDRRESLAQHVGRLAGEIQEVESGYGEKEYAVTESWRQPLRLCVACCDEREVDEVLEAILRPREGEDAERHARPRAVLAAACLADEPNVSEETGRTVIHSFAEFVFDKDRWVQFVTALQKTAAELARSEWSSTLREVLVREFRRRPFDTRDYPGGLCGRTAARSLSEDPKDNKAEMEAWARELRDPDSDLAVQAALAIMAAAFEQKAVLVPDLTDALLDLADRGTPAAHAAYWALAQLGAAWRKAPPGIWKPRDSDISRLLRPAHQQDSDPEVMRWALWSIDRLPDEQGIADAIRWLDCDYPRIRTAAARLLGRTGGDSAEAALIQGLAHPESETRTDCMEGLAETLEDVDRKLVSRYFRAHGSSIDPKEPVEEARIDEAAKKLKLPTEEIRRRYENLADRYGLKLSWR